MSSSTSAENYVIGVDIGGTKVAAGLVNSKGTVLCAIRLPMVTTGGAARGLESVVTAIDAVFSSARTELSINPNAIAGIGICSPGPLDPQTGVVLNPPNVPCWRDFHLADEISSRYHVPVKVDNDANAAGLAESLWGAGCGYRNLFYFALGTGIGSAILFDGRIHHGRTGAAGEGGHVTIDYCGPRCACGKLGCIETLAAGPAIAKRARAKAQLANRSLLQQMAGGDIDRITSEMVGEAYSAGDALAREVLLETADMLVAWLSNIVDLLEPDVMIIGGGVAVLFLPLLTYIQGRLQSSCVNQRAGEIPLLPAYYGRDAGVAGGAALCLGVQ